MAMAADDHIAGTAPAPPAAPDTKPSSASPISVSLHDLESGNIPFSTLEAAFGPSSLGILLVSDLPSKFLPLRQRLLTYASHLAHQDPTALENLTSPAAKYLVGWSHGRETLPPKNVPDFHKGSFYVNCAFYQDPALEAAPTTSAFPHFPEYTSGNIWPEEDVMPGFKETMVEMCTLVIDVAGLVARAVDRFAEERIEGYGRRGGAVDGKGYGYLEGVVRGSYTTKARLLHYFPPAPALEMSNGTNGTSSAATATAATQDSKTEPEEDVAWCTTHLDHGCLTGLLSALYLPSAPLPTLPSLPSGIPCPDPTAGLYIHSRTGAAVKVSIPADCLAFQTGEALQKITQGRFRAVPHYVSPGRDKEAMSGVERNTLAVFTQPNLEDVVDWETGEQFGGFAGEVVGRNTVRD